MRKTALIVCAFLLSYYASSASAALLVFSGATYRAMTGYETLLLPQQERFATKAVYRLDYLDPLDTDTIVYDISFATFFIYESIAPYDLLTTHDDFRMYDVVADVALFNEETALFDVNPTQEEINAIGALVYVGPIHYGALLNSFVTDVASVSDSDGDAIFDEADNCPSVLNPTQTDTDTDGYGDVCDPALISDINFDDTVDLLDVIIALQISTGITVSGNVFEAAAVGGDGMIGLGDAINGLFYISNQTSGENTPERCSDGKDNDRDGYIDCLDSNCRGIGYCQEENTLAYCSDGVDNDGDGYTDCDDSGCARMAVCL